eukprot:222143-Amphidinium_carterae.1
MDENKKTTRHFTEPPYRLEMPKTQRSSAKGEFKMIRLVSWSAHQCGLHTLSVFSVCVKEHDVLGYMCWEKNLPWWWHPGRRSFVAAWCMWVLSPVLCSIRAIGVHMVVVGFALNSTPASLRP